MSLVACPTPRQYLLLLWWDGLTFDPVLTGFAMTFYYRLRSPACFRAVSDDRGKLWLADPLGPPLVCEHDGAANHFAYLPVLPDRLQKPRELTWITGVIPPSLPFRFGVTGLLCLGTKLATGPKIVSGVPEAIPVVGVTISDLLRGGSSVGQATLTRYYSAHICAAR